MPTKILMPALSPTMTEGTLAKWHVKEGDEVHSGDVIAEIETDKATMEVEAVEEGRIGRLVVSEGADGVAVNSVIALLLEEGEDDSALADADVAAPAKPAAKAPAEPSPPPAQSAPTTSAPSPQPAAPPPQAGNGASQSAGNGAGNGAGRVFASPLARRMAQQAGIEISAVSGSGPHGRIVKRDIEAVVAGGQPAPAAAAPAPAAAPPAPSSAAQPFEPDSDLQPMSTMRKVIAERLSESKRTIPHFYLTVDCEIDALLAFRKALNDKADGAYKLSVNDIIIKAVGIALRKVPEANVSWSADGLKRYKSVDIAVAVALDDGLITPVIRGADAKGLEEISAEMRDLAERARAGSLMPEDYQGGTFSISNLGMFGVKQFEAVINPPQACILAVGAGEARPVVKDGVLATATVMSCTLSVDHRAVDGAIGARMLAAFKRMIEDPMAMLL